jgi:dipeptidyl aminopeptidase/acylaminoacyl peptidase
MKNIQIVLLGLFSLWINLGISQTNYQLPPKEILELADVSAPAQSMVSKSNKYLLLMERPQYKSLEELAEPELRLAGLRINPETFDMARAGYYTKLTLKTIANNATIQLSNLPEPLKAKNIGFSPNENFISFIQVNTQGLSLWVIDLKTGAAKELLKDQINNVMGNPFFWANNETGIYVKSKGNKKPFASSKVLPLGPSTQDATGTKSAARTYQDLLKNKQDEAVFTYYASSELSFIQLDGTIKNILPNAIYKRLSLSANESYLLYETISEPFSYTLPYSFFASETQILNLSSQEITRFYSRPLQDKLPLSFDAVEAGKRNIFWHPAKPATLVWCEAPDGGNPAQTSEIRDILYTADAPFTKAEKLCELKNRFRGLTVSDNGIYVVSDFWYKTRNTKTYVFRENKAQDMQVLFDRSSEDAYNDPGNFVTESNKYNREVLKLSKDFNTCYLIGEGYSPEGNKPFIDELNLSTLQRKRIWQAEGKTTYERLLRITNWDKMTALTSIESPKVYPNLYVRNLTSKAKPTQITFKENPYKSLMQVSKQKIFYTRKDGVKLSATLYLPAGYSKEKMGRLPLLMEAYPTEFKDDKAASQIKESPHAFIAINWASPVFWVTRGYAVLEDAQFPIIGKGNDEPNDTYIEQLVADAEAAIKAVDSMGVVDPKRCAVMGHSYGAFMTANLLTHSKLFAAGIARSGAYNRTLTPFGFQAEERSYWQAKEVYQRMSPFTYADQLKSPILFIHGEADNNPGTFTLQSERLFQAVKGNGGTARLVLLPFESHSYAARENILHMLWEMDTWLNRYLSK